MKPQVAVDIDGVLTDAMGPLLAIINADLGVELDQNDLTTWFAFDELLASYQQAIGRPIDDYIEAILHRERFLLAQPLYLPAITGMRRLAGLASKLWIITSRKTSYGPHIARETKQWLDEHGFVYDELIFESDKARFCREQKISYLIEDRDTTVLEAQTMGIGALLIDQPWNRHVNATGLNGIWRLRDLSRAAAVIRADLG